MKKLKKMNRTKVIVLLIIALLGLYVVSSQAASFDTSYIKSNIQASRTEIQNKIAQLKKQLATEVNQRRIEQIKAHIAALQSQISNGSIT